MNLQDKRLPKGWAYGLTPKHVRQLVRDLQADFRVVEFCGPRSPLDLADETVLFLGELNCRVDVDTWCHRIRLWGAPITVMEGHRQLIRDSLLDAVKTTVGGLRLTQADTSMRPRDQSLRIRIKNGKFYPDFETKDRNSLGASIDQDDPWWLP